MIPCKSATTQQDHTMKTEDRKNGPMSETWGPGHAVWSEIGF